MEPAPTTQIFMNQSSGLLDFEQQEERAKEDKENHSLRSRVTICAA
jgi:hypothetical protein